MALIIPRKKASSIYRKSSSTSSILVKLDKCFARSLQGGSLSIAEIVILNSYLTRRLIPIAKSGLPAMEANRNETTENIKDPWSVLQPVLNIETIR